MAWRGQAALARPTPPRASGAALGGPHGAVDCPSGTKGQQPLVFPASHGLRGRAWAPTNLRRALGVSFGRGRGEAMKPLRTDLAELCRLQLNDSGGAAR
jgi:hypothetical protein